MKRKILYWEGGQKLEQVAQRGSEVSIFGDVKRLSVQSSEQPNLVRPALSRALDWLTSKGLFQPKLFYNSMSLIDALRRYLRGLSNSACFPL